MADLARIRLLAMDVDGTMTDGGVYFHDDGTEAKRFHIHDGLGIVLAAFVGLRIAWLTGRSSPLVKRRADELGIEHLYQGVRDKSATLVGLTTRLGLTPDSVAYIGDDFNDLPALRIAAVAIAPANAIPEVKTIAHLVTPRAGGQGAVRDAIEAILRARGDYAFALEAYLLSLSNANGKSSP